MPKRKIDHASGGASSAMSDAVRKAQEAAAAIAAKMTAGGAIGAKAGAPSSARAQQPSPAKKPRMQYKALLLDEQGREIDEQGNLVEQVARPGSTAVGGRKYGRQSGGGDSTGKRLGARAKSTSISKPSNSNPYLAHLDVVEEGRRGTRAAENEAGDTGTFDPRLSSRASNGSSMRGLMNSFAFVEPGSLVEAEEKHSERQRGLEKSGRASGRKDPEVLTERGAAGAAPADAVAGGDSSSPPYSMLGSTFKSIPELNVGDCECPVMEWWDLPFLSKPLREDMKELGVCTKVSSSGTGVNVLFVGGMKARRTADDKAAPYSAQCYKYLDEMSPAYCKTITLVQHAPPVVPVRDTGEVQLPMYLTKKERKKLRRAAREEKEQAKRDLQMMGLAPAPEPKLKLSNFMKVLGDSAVANPSAVEKKVLEKVKQRQLAHEIRNLSQKLVGKAMTEKQLRKFKKEPGAVRGDDAGGPGDDQGSGTSNGPCHVAVFRVGSLASNKHRYQLDVSAQQFCLSGVALTPAAPDLPDDCTDLPAPIPVDSSLVIVEGGSKGVTKFTRLLTVRMDWSILPRPDNTGDKEEDKREHKESSEHEVGTSECNSDGRDIEVAEQEEKEKEKDAKANSVRRRSRRMPTEPRWRGAELLWTGTVDRHAFKQFKFQEYQTPAAARHTLLQKGLQHYWDLLAQADSCM